MDTASFCSRCGGKDPFCYICGIARPQQMTESEENCAYWTEAYATDLARGRDDSEFGMRWMRHQIDVWKEAVEAEKMNERPKPVEGPDPIDPGSPLFPKPNW